MYYTYMVRCADNSIYTGMTNNLEKRINEHINKRKKWSKIHKITQCNKIRNCMEKQRKSTSM